MTREEGRVPGAHPLARWPESDPAGDLGPRAEVETWREPRPHRNQNTPNPHLFVWPCPRKKDPLTHPVLCASPGRLTACRPGRRLRPRLFFLSAVWEITYWGLKRTERLWQVGAFLLPLKTGGLGCGPTPAGRTFSWVEEFRDVQEWACVSETTPLKPSSPMLAKRQSIVWNSSPFKLQG